MFWSVEELFLFLFILLSGTEEAAARVKSATQYELGSEAMRNNNEDEGVCIDASSYLCCSYWTGNCCLFASTNSSKPFIDACTIPAAAAVAAAAALFQWELETQKITCARIGGINWLIMHAAYLKELIIFILNINCPQKESPGASKSAHLNSK